MLFNRNCSTWSIFSEPVSVGKLCDFHVETLAAPWYPRRTLGQRAAGKPSPDVLKATKKRGFCRPASSLNPHSPKKLLHVEQFLARRIRAFMVGSPRSLLGEENMFSTWSFF